ncbi:MAG: hypothetical protein LBL82_05645, partial [Oscillospiraceae bacterium]|nr:hypothetical protein [Oscillospiraceae bacterium]
DDLAKTLSPVFEGYVAVSHVNTSIFRLTEYNRIFYVSEANGVTLIEYGRGRAEANKYRLTWYSDLAAFNADFITAFGLSSVAPYSKKPFKICDEAQIIDDLMKAKISKNKEIEDFARRHEADPEQIKFILKAVKSKRNMFLINVIRHESIKSGAIMVKLMLAEQFMMKIIFSPDGDLISFESFSQEGLINQIINFEGR